MVSFISNAGSGRRKSWLARGWAESVMGDFVFGPIVAQILQVQEMVKESLLDTVYTMRKLYFMD